MVAVDLHRAKVIAHLAECSKKGASRRISNLRHYPSPPLSLRPSRLFCGPTNLFFPYRSRGRGVGAGCVVRNLSTLSTDDQFNPTTRRYPSPRRLGVALHFPTVSLQYILRQTLALLWKQRIPATPEQPWRLLVIWGTTWFPTPQPQSTQGTMSRPWIPTRVS